MFRNRTESKPFVCQQRTEPSGQWSAGYDQPPPLTKKLASPFFMDGIPAYPLYHPLLLWLNTTCQVLSLQQQLGEWQ